MPELDSNGAVVNRPKLWGVLISVLIAAGSLVLAALTHEPKKAVSSPAPASAAILPPQMADAKSEAEIMFRGKSFAGYKRNVILYFGADVIEAPVVEGQTVKEGDTLAVYKMDRPAMMEIRQILYGEQVLSLKRALFDLEVSLDKLKNVALPVKKSKVERIEKEVSDLKDLEARNMAHRDAVDLKERELSAAKKDVEDVHESIKQTEENIRKAKKDLHFAEDKQKRALDLLEWQTKRSYSDSSVPDDLGYLKAPISGRLVWVSPMLRVGAELPKGFHAMTVAPPDGIVVRCKVHELDFVKLKTGDKGSLSFDAFPEKEYGCKISRIPLVSRNPALEVPADYEVECMLDAADDILREGLTCNVRIRVTH
jgi:biotin carboxyl carrier protein